MSDTNDSGCSDSPSHRTEQFGRFSGQRFKHKGGGGGFSSNRVYISNLPKEYLWQDLKNLLSSEVGDVRFAKILSDECGSSTGCGFAVFFDKATLEKCIEKMQGFVLKGHKLSVNAEVKGGSDEEGASDRESPAGFRDRSPNRGAAPRKGPNFSRFRVHVSNIPFTVSWQGLKDLFQSEVGDVQYVRKFVDKQKILQDYAIVEFSAEAAFHKCLEKMQGFRLNGLALVVEDDRGNNRDTDGALVGCRNVTGDNDKLTNNHYVSSSTGGGDKCGSDVAETGNGKWGNTYGLSVDFLESLNIKGPLCSKVFVRNIDVKADRGKLYEVFRLAGRVVQVHILSKEGNRRHHAVVEYEHPVEAVQAISLFHGQVLYSRALRVRLDEKNESIKLPEGLHGIGMGLGPDGALLKDVVHNLPSESSECNQRRSDNTNSSKPVLTGLTNIMSNPSTELNDLLTNSTTNNPMVTNSLTDLNTLSSLLMGLNNVVANASMATLLSNPLQAALTNLLGKSFGANNFSGHTQNATPQMAGHNVNTSNNLSVFNNERQTKPFGSNQIAGSSKGFDATGTDMGIVTIPSKKIVVTNLPPTASYRALHTKFSEFGEVRNLGKLDDGVLVIYNSEQHAEKAVKSLDGAHVDGCYIGARFHY